jgi:hypothetical protein
MKYSKISRRYLAILMVFVFMFGLLPGMVWAADEGSPAAPAATPSFTTDLSPDAVTYTVGDAAAALTVEATAPDGGVITYQWYGSTVNSAGGGTAIIGETASSFTPPTTVAGTVYYYATATNTLEASTATAPSNIAAVTVTGKTMIYDPSAFEAMLAAKEAEKAAREAAAEQEYLDMLREAGVELDPFGQMRMSLRDAPVTLAQEGDFLGYVTISLERFAAGTGYVLEPVSYPLYAGDTIADIVHSVSTYKNPLGIGQKTYHANAGSLDRDFVLTGLWDPSPPADAVPATIVSAAVALGGQATNRQTSGWLKNSDLYSTGQWLLWLNNELRASSFLTDFSSAPDMQTLQPGDVIRLQYSVTGDGRDLGTGDSRLYDVADKDRLTEKVAELNSWGQDLLTNSSYRSAFDHALMVLKDLQATQQQVDTALLALLDKPAVNLDGVPIDNTKDILMGNIEGRVRVGSEWEVIALDYPRTDDDDRNFVRGDLNLEVVQGKGLVSIRRAPGAASGATQNGNMYRGYTFFVKGLKQGLAKIRVSYPTYQGRETYIVIHVTDRDSDYTNALNMSSSLDYITKYDTIHYDSKTQNYPITIDTPFMVQSFPAPTMVMYVNGSCVNPVSLVPTIYMSGQPPKTFYMHSPTIPLTNGYNTIILSATNGGVQQTRVYQIRASRLTVTLENETRPGSAIYEGDQVKVRFTGLVNPLPKVSRLYNPSQGQISYYTDMPFLTQIYGSSSQYSLTTSTVSFTATGAGTYSLHDGFLRVVGFCGAGWLETPQSQVPAYKGRPVMTVGGGGPNVPQSFMSFSFLPDFTFTVLEDPTYNPVRVAATPDKEVYAPGETVTISMPDLNIAEIQSHHNLWYPIVDDTLGTDSKYGLTTAITQASVVFSTDIPGLGTVRSREFVDVNKIIANIRTGDPVIGADGTTEIHVINNYYEGASVAGLVYLKTLTFTIPDNTPSGTYKLKGGYADVEYGPYWWVKYVTYFGGEIEDVAVTVERAVAPGDAQDGRLVSMTIDTSTAFVYDTDHPEAMPIGSKSLSMPYINNYGPTFNWTSAHKEILLSVMAGGKTDGATLEYRGADGLPVTEYLKNSLLGIKLPKIPLQFGDNQFALKVRPQGESTAAPTTYTFNVRRVVDDRITYHAELTGLYYTTATPNTDIPGTPGTPHKGVIIESGEDLTSSEPGKSYIKVGYQVDKILLSARVRDPEASINLSNLPSLNIPKLTAHDTANNVIEFRDDKDLFAGVNGSPLLNYPPLEEPIELHEGMNEIRIHIEARDRVDAEDPGVAADHLLYVTRLPDASLKTVDVAGGRLESGGFYPGIGTIKVASSGNAEGKFTMTFTATEGAVISRDNPATAENTITPGVPAAFEAPDPIVSDTLAETPKRYPIFVTRTVGEEKIVTQYEIVAYRASETTSGETVRYSPSSGSQVSLLAAVKDDDSNPDGVFRALTGGYKTQLGLLGGFVEYKLDRLIDNDPNNNYGIDFVIYGAVTAKNNAFPGTVQVARDVNGDGQPDRWYTLAGSEYYSDGTDHDVSVTYQKMIIVVPGMAYFDDSGQRTGQFWAGGYYPDPLFSSRWNSAVTSDTSTTFTGTLLSTRSPAFGYADVHPMGLNGARPSQPDKAVNPYRTGDLYSGSRGDGFDLAWAVDENGLPVELDSVSFIRVTSSYLSSTQADANGTVLTSIVDVTGEDTSVGESDLQSLKVNGQDFPLQDGVYTYELLLDGPQDVTISASTSGRNLYVNGQALGHEVESAPIYFDGSHSRVVRLIVQSEEKTPKIYYLVLEPKIEINAIALDKSSVELRIGEQIHLTPIITPFSANTAYVTHWFSTSPVVASVNNDGLVTALLVGTTTISAQIGEKWAQCSVRVLPTEQNTDQAAANAVIALINQIPDGAQSNDARVTAARAAYDLLTAVQKALVTNYARLTAAEANVPSGGGGNTITVTFRLIGDSKHGAPEDDPESTTYHVAYQNWIKTRTYTLPENSTVYHLFAKALGDAGLDFEARDGFGYENNYIAGIESPITGEMLREFDNGRWSGWMYTVNDVHPNIGLAAKVLANGDRVVWHYMDNFYVELDKQPWLTVPDTDPNAKPDNTGNTGGPGGGGTTPSSGGSTLAPKVTATDGVAAASVNTADLNKAIADAKTKGSDSIVIAPEITGEANKVSVDISKASLASIASETEAGLTVETPVGSISIPNGALVSIASQATESTVTVSLATVDNSTLTPEQQETVGDNPVYDINVLSGGVNISGFGGESITISIPYTLKEGEAPENVTVWYLNNAGELERVACTYDPATGMATFTTDHLSYYMVGYIEAAPPAVPGQTFSDVSPLDWFYVSVTSAVYRELMNGTSATAFSPNDPTNRAMLVTVLYRLEGSPQVTKTSSFTDVKDGEWYTDAVTWANANNIVTGYGGGLFGANDSVTREQMATILHRYASYKHYDTTKTADLASYTDAPEIGAWALDALKWANAEGLIAGRTATTLAPGGTATRAEVATILIRFAEGFVE